MEWINIETEKPPLSPAYYPQMGKENKLLVATNKGKVLESVYTTLGFSRNGFEKGEEVIKWAHWPKHPGAGGVVENFAHEPTKEPLTEALNKHNVGGRSEQLKIFLQEVADWEHDYSSTMHRIMAKELLKNF